ncbi:uncharacterized protein [Elaeis guineensis]|uniref:uncharacterized protein n=1 Tax=Elaeis guineensis var. tenera TaxID=51953 RepID=UPI003C6CEF3A
MAIPLIPNSRTRLTTYALVRDRPAPPPTPSFVTPQIPSSSFPSHALGLIFRNLAAASTLTVPINLIRRYLAMLPRHAALPCGHTVATPPCRAACALAVPPRRLATPPGCATSSCGPYPRHPTVQTNTSISPQSQGSALLGYDVYYALNLGQ